ncbi:hypothetical protein E2C01_063126 [Portunus trituberculatus]|uniref:Uncharacterized protein n=1 Tax=Portunus trituberculatus TaxID=210409 RepID=A0A5B7HH97_PORTR|nr:hypothetical protein [Portunus trituberculatus]
MIRPRPSPNASLPCSLTPLFPSTYQHHHPLPSTSAPFYHDTITTLPTSLSSSPLPPPFLYHYNSSTVFRIPFYVLAVTWHWGTGEARKAGWRDRKQQQRGAEA